MRIPENKRIVYERLDIAIGTGNTSFSDTVSLRQGTCIGVKVIPFAGHTGLDHAINIGAEDTSGNEVVGKTDFRDYASTGGDYLNSFKTVNFDTRKQVNVSALATKGLTAAFYAQMVFAVLIDA